MQGTTVSEKYCSLWYLDPLGLQTAGDLGPKVVPYPKGPRYLTIGNEGFPY